MSRFLLQKVELLSTTYNNFSQRATTWFVPLVRFDSIRFEAMLQTVAHFTVILIDTSHHYEFRDIFKNFEAW